MFPAKLYNFHLLKPSSSRIFFKFYSDANSVAANVTSQQDEKRKIVNVDSISKAEIDPASGLPFRRLTLIPIKKTDDAFVEVTAKPYSRVTPPSRADRMPTDQDWPSVWPTAQSFKASAVPLPVRMGYQTKLKKPPPSKVANLELLKIPNFLHLTPPAIKRQCEAIKQFCTKWPAELTADEQGNVLRRTHFPIEITAYDYVHSGPSIRDPRSRVVTLQVKVSDVPLGGADSRQRYKFIKLAAERYNKSTDVLTIVTDRCPVRHQNRHYAMYLLAVLYHEAWKEEPWEGDITAEDRLKQRWFGSKSEKAVIDLVNRLRMAYETARSKETTKQPVSYPQYLQQVKGELTEKDIIKLTPIKHFAESWEQYRNNSENVENISAYGNAVRAIYGLPSALEN